MRKVQGNQKKGGARRPDALVAGVGDPGDGLSPFDKLRAPSLSRGEAGDI
jgi:hypothetical protein